jgi:hypothetical protein
MICCAGINLFPCCLHCCKWECSRPPSFSIARRYGNSYINFQQTEAISQFMLGKIIELAWKISLATILICIVCPQNLSHNHTVSFASTFFINHVVAETFFINHVASPYWMTPYSSDSSNHSFTSDFLSLRDLYNCQSKSLTLKIATPMFAETSEYLQNCKLPTSEILSHTVIQLCVKSVVLFEVPYNTSLNIDQGVTPRAMGEKVRHRQLVTLTLTSSLES